MKSIIGFFSVCLLSGCVMYGRQAAELPHDLPESWSSQVAVSELPITSGLLDFADDEQLHALVLEALDNNPNLGATANRLEAQGYLLGLTRSQMLPRVNGSFSAGRSDLDAREFSSHRLGLGMSWELDLWGKLADEHAAAKGARRASEQDWHSARDALAARVIQTWVEQVFIRRVLDIESERVEVLQKVDALLVQRYRDGMGSLDELSTARSRVGIAKADLSAQEVMLHESSRRLELLLGRYPSGNLSAANELPAIKRRGVNIPATVLLSRPDIRAALEQVESSRRTARAAKKERLPSIKLSGEVFRDVATLGGLGGAENQWSLLGSLFQPLFDGGRIRSATKARESEADATLLDLHSVVLKALKEVEDALDLEQRLLSQAESLAAAAKDSKTSSDYYAKRYRQGLDSLQSWLIATEQEMTVRLRLNEVQGRQLINRVDLALALGTSAVTGESQ